MNHPTNVSPRDGSVGLFLAPAAVKQANSSNSLIVCACRPFHVRWLVSGWVRTARINHYYYNILGRKKKKADTSLLMSETGAAAETNKWNMGCIIINYYSISSSRTFRWGSEGEMGREVE